MELQLPIYLLVFPPSELIRNLDQYKVSGRTIFIPPYSQTLQKLSLYKEYSTKGKESENYPRPGARIREGRSGKMLPGEGGNGGSEAIQDACRRRRCEVPDSRGRWRDCYMCVWYSPGQVLYNGLCRYVDRSTTFRPSSEPVLWHYWAWSDWYTSNATEISWRPLQAPYTDPATGLRYHDKSVYEYIKSLVCLFVGCPLKGVLIWDMHRIQVRRKNTYLVGTCLTLQVRIYSWLTYPIARGVNSIVK